MDIFDKFWKRDVKGSMDKKKQGEMKAPVRIKPDYAEAHYNLGTALGAKGLVDEAIMSYENFIRYAPPQYAGYVEKVKGIIRQLRGQR